MRAFIESGGKSLSQHSQLGRSSSIGILSPSVGQTAGSAKDFVPSFSDTPVRDRHHSSDGLQISSKTAAQAGG
jgi:hypothetical protein